MADVIISKETADEIWKFYDKWISNPQKKEEMNSIWQKLFGDDARFED